MAVSKTSNLNHNISFVNSNKTKKDIKGIEAKMTEQWVQWILTTIIAIVAIIVVRIWGRYDHRLKKDKYLLDTILKIVPTGSDTYLFLKQHDFGDAFRREPLRPLQELEMLLAQPSNFFLNKRLEKMKQQLCQDIKEFYELLLEKTFPHEVTRDFFEIPKPDQVFIRRTRFIEGQRKLSDEELSQLKKGIHKAYEQTRKELNKRSDNICEKYDVLISTAHRIL